MSADTDNLTPLVRAFARMVADELKQATGANPNELLTVRELARELRLGKDAVIKLIASGTLRRVKDIRERRVSRRELERYTGGAKP